MRELRLEHLTTFEMLDNWLEKEAWRLQAFSDAKPGIPYVYMVSASDEAVKIGYSKDVFKRLATIQTSNFMLCEGLIVVEATSKTGREFRLDREFNQPSVTLEWLFHKAFQHLHLRGEWFARKAELEHFLRRALRNV